MLPKSIATRLAALPAKARELAEIQLRTDGVIGATDALEKAFDQDTSATHSEMRDCLDECDDSYDEAIDDCKTDACKAGAAIALSKCVNGC